MARARKWKKRLAPFSDSTAGHAHLCPWKWCKFVPRLIGPLFINKPKIVWPRGGLKSGDYCIILTFPTVIFARNRKSNKGLLKKVLSTKNMNGKMCKFTNVWTLLCFEVKCIILVLLGVLTIGIQNSYILQIRYEPHLSDMARCSEASRFSNTKIWYA